MNVLLVDPVDCRRARIHAVLEGLNTTICLVSKIRSSGGIRAQEFDLVVAPNAGKTLKNILRVWGVRVFYPSLSEDPTVGDIQRELAKVDLIK